MLINPYSPRAGRLRRRDAVFCYSHPERRRIDSAVKCAGLNDGGLRQAKTWEDWMVYPLAMTVLIIDNECMILTMLRVFLRCYNAQLRADGCEYGR